MIEEEQAVLKIRNSLAGVFNLQLDKIDSENLCLRLTDDDVSLFDFSDPIKNKKIFALIYSTMTAQGQVASKPTSLISIYCSLFWVLNQAKEGVNFKQSVRYRSALVSATSSMWDSVLKGRRVEMAVLDTTDIGQYNSDNFLMASVQLQTYVDPVRIYK